MSTPGFQQAMTQAASAVGAAVGGAAGNIAAGARSIAAGAHNLSVAASAGKLSIDPQTGKDMTDAITEMQMQVAELQQGMHELVQRPKLGNSPDAAVMADHSTGVANGDQSAKNALDGLQQALNDLKAGIKQSMDNYGHTDAGGARNFNQIPH